MEIWFFSCYAGILENNQNIGFFQLISFKIISSSLTVEFLTFDPEILSVNKKLSLLTEIANMNRKFWEHISAPFF